MKKYQITKQFIAGLLQGITITEQTEVKFAVGFISDGRFGSQYKILSCKEV